MAEIYAETERLLLRPEVEGDQAVWLAHMNSPDVTDHLGGPKTPEQIADSFARMAAAAAGNGLIFALVALRDGETLIGKCGLGPIDSTAAPAALQGEAQIGWTLRADYWGHGYALEAARAMLAMGFGRFGLDRIYAQVSDRNHPSLRLIERLGMSRRPDLDYVDPDFEPRDNPTRLFAIDHAQWHG